MPLIAMAHEIPYVATATVAELRDLERKVDARDGAARPALPPRARPVPAGLGIGAPRTRSRSRVWPRRAACSPCSRPKDGEVVVGLADPPAASPSRSTCAARSATRTCSRATAARRTIVAQLQAPRRPQHRALRPARRRARRRERPRAARGARRRRSGGRCEHPTESRPSGRSRSPSTSARASPTRPARGAPNGPSTCGGLPPCNDACPAGEDIQRWLYEAESGGEGYERAWRRSCGTTRSPPSWAGSATTRARRPATAVSSTRRSASTRVERFLGDEAIRRGWELPAARRRRRDARARRRRGAVRAVGAPTTWRCAGTT